MVVRGHATGSKVNSFASDDVVRDVQCRAECSWCACRCRPQEQFDLDFFRPRPLMDACRISHGSCTGSASLLNLFLLCLNHARVQASETGRLVFFHTKPAPLLLKRNALLRFERLHNLTTGIPMLNAPTAPCTLALPLDRKSFALSTSYVFLPASATGTPTICSAACSSVSPVGLNAQQLSLDTVLVKLLVFVRNGAKVFVFHAVGIDARQPALGLVLITLQKWRKGPRISCPLAARFEARGVPTPISAENT